MHDDDDILELLTLDGAVPGQGEQPAAGEPAGQRAWSCHIPRRAHHDAADGRRSGTGTHCFFQKLDFSAKILNSV